ncbi:glycosyltransferase family 32 protein [Microvirga arsenatis]|uniref:Alpha 1,4-glycosyltransferase domain-containing protein n=1 Tax=Microvirga arsenatis TaxID=2692265 RepID=A0ABW9YXU8_9HYPH|nr:hypothetical protein [Microvirga arsenatis]NBJ10777.1 hypothetical protein [Microvirga arsenatis]NBJ24325.1 hypothetical protein [Microvirga arsenatis]
MFGRWFHKREAFNAFWHGAALSPVAVMSLNSFLSRGFSVDLYTYGDVKFVPAGVSRRPAEAILPKERLFEAHGGFEHFADLFRYCLIRKVGGWWIDTDVVCNTDRVPRTDIAFAFADRAGTINNGQFKFPRSHPVMVRAAEEAAAADISAWGASGPDLLTRIVAGAGIDRYRWDQSQLYPIHWAEAAKLLLPEYRGELEERTRRSAFIHLYAAMFRLQCGFDPNRFLPPKGSYLEGLYLRYGIGEAADHLEPVDEAALRQRIVPAVQEPWLQNVLAQEGLQFSFADAAQRLSAG